MEGKVDKPKALNLLAEKIVPQPVDGDQLAYCPTMDLLAVGSKDDQVHVFRLNGQRVFGASSGKLALQIRRLHWKPTGQLLAVAWTDNIIRLISPHTAKIVHQLFSGVGPSPKVTFLDWCSNFTDGKSARARIENRADILTLDDVLSKTLYAQTLNSDIDLPKNLALLDVDGTLPKLSVLVAGGRDGDDVFSSRASIDAMFQAPSQTVDDSVDVMLTGFDNGTFHVRIYECFEIGNFNLGQASPVLEGCEPLLHASHPYTSTHTLFACTRSGPGNYLYFVPLDLRFISNSGQYLSLLASRSTQLQHLLRYIRQVQNQIMNEWKSTQELPNRFMRNIDEALQEECQCSWVHAAYHLVVTGNCFAPVKEWLVNELTERGHKRWEKVVVTGYENIRRLTHESLLPALERCVVLLGRLRGLARHGTSDATLGLSAQDLTNVIDTINCLNLMAHNILIHASVELQQFTAFSMWLRHEIDIQAADPSSASAEEMAEKDTLIDHAKVLDYIQGAMTKSRLVEFFQPPDLEGQMKHDLAAEGTSLYATYKKELKKYGGGDQIDKRLPRLADLFDHLSKQCEVIFNSISETQRRNVMYGTPVLIDRNCSTRMMDARMQPETNHTIGQNVYVTYLALRPADKTYLLRLYRLRLKIENGVSSVCSTEETSINLPSGVIKDIKFVDDESLMLIWSGEQSSRLLCFPYGETARMPFFPLSGHISDLHKQQQPHGCAIGLDVSFVSSLTPYTRHMFRQESTSQPEKLEVNGRKGRRVVCVLDKDGLRYKVFDLDSSADTTRTKHSDDEVSVSDDDEHMSES